MRGCFLVVLIFMWKDEHSEGFTFACAAMPAKCNVSSVVCEIGVVQGMLLTTGGSMHSLSTQDCISKVWE